MIESSRSSFALRHKTAGSLRLRWPDRGRTRQAIGGRTSTSPSRWMLSRSQFLILWQRSCVMSSKASHCSISRSGRSPVGCSCGEAGEPVPGPQRDDTETFGHAVHHAVRARVCIERDRLLQAEYWISCLRNETLALASRRAGVQDWHARGAHLLSAELGRALRGAVNLFSPRANAPRGSPPRSRLIFGPARSSHLLN